MKIETRGYGLVALGLVALFCAGCQKAAAQTVGIGTKAEAPLVKEPRPTSWSDPRVIAELAKSCAFDPLKLDKEERQKWFADSYMGERNVFSCDSGLDQSCVYDPCFEDEERNCKPNCGKTCHSCGDQCITSCESCKKDCKDSACKMSCAKSCAGCRETCVRQRDRCATGTCSDQYHQCRVKLKADWRRNGCKGVCKTYLDCQKRCLKGYKEFSDGFDKCTKPCQPKDNKGCNFMLCGGPYGMGINPEDSP